MLFRSRLLEKKQDENFKSVFISIPKVIKYDIEKLKLEMNEQFNLMKEIQQ